MERFLAGVRKSKHIIINFFHKKFCMFHTIELCVPNWNNRNILHHAWHRSFTYHSACSCSFIFKKNQQRHWNALCPITTWTACVKSFIAMNQHFRVHLILNFESSIPVFFGVAIFHWFQHSFIIFLSVKCELIFKIKHL